MPFRDGFDVTKHPFSFLLIGSPGWIQSIVFVVVGVLFAAAGAGLVDVVGGRVGKVACVSAAGVGAGKIVAGLAAPQPPTGPSRDAGWSARRADHREHRARGRLRRGRPLLDHPAGRARRGAAPTRETGTAWLVLIAAAALPAIPATSGASFGTLLLYAVAISAYFATLRHCCAARRGRGMRAGTRVA